MRARGAFLLILLMIPAAAMAMSMFDWIPRVRTSTDVNEYPTLLEVCRHAAPAQQRLMLEIVDRAEARKTKLSFSWLQRRQFLQAGGYCTGFFDETACTPLPAGKEAVGLVVESFKPACLNPHKRL